MRYDLFFIAPKKFKSLNISWEVFWAQLNNKTTIDAFIGSLHNNRITRLNVFVLTRATIFILVKSRKNTFVPFHTIMNSNTCFGSKIIPSSHYAYILKTSVIVVNMRRFFFVTHNTLSRKVCLCVFHTKPSQRENP